MKKIYLIKVNYECEIEAVDEVEAEFEFWDKWVNDIQSTPETFISEHLEIREKKIKCNHECDVFYGELSQEDGTPFYKVVCSGCKKNGRIMLEEGENIFEE